MGNELILTNGDAVAYLMSAGADWRAERLLGCWYV
jgi:hypothetical protein